MKIVKLNAINSTNTYLKQLAKDVEIGDWTVVTAEFQTLGRGQVQTKWESKHGKNLLCSILIKFENLEIDNQFYLNCAISLGIYNALKKYKLPELKIKWPNDIMSDNKKLGGILIENSLKNKKIYKSVVGFGLNINQYKFPDYLPSVISMKQILKTDFDRDTILKELVASIKKQVELLNQFEFELLHKKYEEVLYKKNVPYIFKSKNQKFLGEIISVNKNGKLKVKIDNNYVKTFAFKEIKFLK